jgi:hypothetical protein
MFGLFDVSAAATKMMTVHLVVVAVVFVGWKVATRIASLLVWNCGDRERVIDCVPDFREYSFESIDGEPWACDDKIQLTCPRRW